MVGVHRVHVRAHAPAERGQPVGCRRIGARGRGQEPPAVAEQRGEARVGAGMFRPGQWVPGDELHARGQVRRDRVDHRALDGPHVGDRGARRQMRGDLLGERSHRADGNRQHHKVRTRHRLGRRGTDPVHKAARQCHVAGGCAAGVAHDLARQPRLADCQTHRPRDQPQSDQRDPVVEGGGHAAAPGRAALNRRTTSATRAQSSSRPTVMRRQCGSL